MRFVPKVAAPPITDWTLDKWAEVTAKTGLDGCVYDLKILKKLKWESQIGRVLLFEFESSFVFSSP